MKQYRSLIKLKKREVDGLRKQLARLDEQRAILQQLLDNLHKELETEILTAGAIVDMGVFFGDYSENIKGKQEKVSEQIDKIDIQRNSLRDKIFIGFSEQKKFELVLQAKLDSLAKKRQKQEQEALDELAASRHYS